MTRIAEKLMTAQFMLAIVFVSLTFLNHCWIAGGHKIPDDSDTRKPVTRHEIEQLKLRTAIYDAPTRMR